jgi:hypothetical protein
VQDGVRIEEHYGWLMDDEYDYDSIQAFGRIVAHIEKAWPWGPEYLILDYVRVRLKRPRI